jgi:hypothetical protein
MAGNNRVYFPVNTVSIGAYCSHSGTAIHGLQSVTTTTSFSLDRVQELGQLEIYENIENLPNVEMSLEKVIDGYPLIYHLATPTSTSSSLANRSNQRCDVFLSIFSDAQDSASGTAVVQAYCSGMYINSLSYTLPVQGNCSETVTLVGNDKVWLSSNFAFFGQFNNTDSPASGTKRRQNVVMGNAGAGGSVWPTNLPGITTTTGSGYNISTGGVFGAHIQDVTISTNLGREDLFELGARKPYYRYANFPVAVDCTINITAGGTNPSDAINADSNATNNLSNEPIVIRIDDGTVFNLGTKNKLQSVTFNGGAAGGGVATMAYAYQNFNALTVLSRSDPAGLTS